MDPAQAPQPAAPPQAPPQAPMQINAPATVPTPTGGHPRMGSERPVYSPNAPTPYDIYSDVSSGRQMPTPPQGQTQQEPNAPGNPFPPNGQFVTPYAPPQAAPPQGQPAPQPPQAPYAPPQQAPYAPQPNNVELELAEARGRLAAQEQFLQQQQRAAEQDNTPSGPQYPEYNPPTPPEMSMSRPPDYSRELALSDPHSPSAKYERSQQDYQEKLSAYNADLQKYNIEHQRTQTEALMAWQREQNNLIVQQQEQMAQQAQIEQAQAQLRHSLQHKHGLSPIDVNGFFEFMQNPEATSDERIWVDAYRAFTRRSGEALLPVQPHNPYAQGPAGPGSPAQTGPVPGGQLQSGPAVAPPGGTGYPQQGTFDPRFATGDGYVDPGAYQRAQGQQAPVMLPAQQPGLAQRYPQPAMSAPAVPAGAAAAQGSGDPMQDYFAGMVANTQPPKNIWQADQMRPIR